MTHSSHTSTERLDEIQARAEKATDGPWEYAGDYYGVIQHTSQAVEVGGYKYAAVGIVPGEEIRLDDAEFIAHARTDVPDLVGALQSVLDLCDSTTLECRPGDGSQPYMVVPADAVKAAIEVALEEARP